MGHKIDMAIAWCVLVITLYSEQSLTLVCRNFERIIIEAYRWLSDIYEDGDCIYLFGGLIRALLSK
jgi:uncharacterized protein (DUF2235 family)